MADPRFRRKTREWRFEGAEVFAVAVTRGNVNVVAGGGPTWATATLTVEAPSRIDALLALNALPAPRLGGNRLTWDTADAEAACDVEVRVAPGASVALVALDGVITARGRFDRVAARSRGRVELRLVAAAAVLVHAPSGLVAAVLEEAPIGRLVIEGGPAGGPRGEGAWTVQDARLPSVRVKLARAQLHFVRCLFADDQGERSERSEQGERSERSEQGEQGDPDVELGAGRVVLRDVFLRRRVRVHTESARVQCLALGDAALLSVTGGGPRAVSRLED